VQDHYRLEANLHVLFAALLPGHAGFTRAGALILS
jgi:hypothetical protein